MKVVWTFFVCVFWEWVASVDVCQRQPLQERSDQAHENLLFAKAEWRAFTPTQKELLEQTREVEPRQTRLTLLSVWRELVANAPRNPKHVGCASRHHTLEAWRKYIYGQITLEEFWQEDKGTVYTELYEGDMNFHSEFYHAKKREEANVPDNKRESTEDP